MFVSLSAVGQIGVVIECDNDKYMVGEAVMAKVVVDNNVEVPLVFAVSFSFFLFCCCLCGAGLWPFGSFVAVHFVRPGRYCCHM